MELFQNNLPYMLPTPLSYSIVTIDTPVLHHHYKASFLDLKVKIYSFDLLLSIQKARINCVTWFLLFKSSIQ
jgi:hypothetical protein